LFQFFISSMTAACPAHLIFLGLVTLLIFGEECELWSFSWSSFHWPPAPPSTWSPNILLSSLFSDTLSVCGLPLWWETKFHTHTEQRV
jgi:hypothetical protein